MKRTIAFLLTLALTAALTGCGGTAAPAATDAPAETAPAQSLPETTAPQDTLPAQETQPASQAGLYLKVSAITFSLVGESEDIYLGLAPRDQVTWRSDDPSVVEVADGVLTATGVGTTTVHASCNGQEVTVTAGCLAQTREALEALDPAVLSAPKRLPPEVDLSGTCTWFDTSAIVGDSITYFLWQYESGNNYLGNMTFLSRHGISIHGLVNYSKNMYFEGKEMHVEDIVAAVNPQRTYLMLGCLDFQVPSSRLMLMDHWTLLLDRIEEKAPDTEIVIISNIPSFTKLTTPSTFNTAVAETTVQLRQLAADRGYPFLDLGYYIQDHYGRMPEIYCQDEFHLNDEGSLVWVKLLRFYALYEQEGGSLV